MSAATNATITTIRPAITQDAQGTDVEDFDAVDGDATVIDIDVPVSIQQMSQADVTRFQKRGMNVDFEIFAFQSVMCKQGDRATDANGVIYVIRDVEDMAGRGRAFNIRAKKLRESS